MKRRLFLGLAAMAAVPARAAVPEVRLGVLQFGTVQWIADIIRRHDLDTRHGFALSQTMLANTDAGRVSLMAGASDVILSDWPFAAAQRVRGTQMAFAAFSSATGGIVVPAGSPIRALADLRGRKLGIAGGPADKSWLVVQAAARATAKLDLAKDAQPVFGAPPLLGAKLQQGELDAVLTYWNFAARLEAAGYREAVSVADCLRAVGIDPNVSLIGFVFRDNTAGIDGFLAAVKEAESLLPGEWDRIRPLMQAPDDALFQRLRQRFTAGLSLASDARQIAGAERLLQVLRETGGTRATDGIETLPPGLFWPGKHGTG